MSRPFLRVDLSADATDFSPLIVQMGLPLLDRWNTHGRLLGDWLGRFVAEPVWEGETVAYYVRDDSGNRLADVTGVAATEADLQGALKDEREGLQDRLRRATPQSSSAHAIHQFLSRGWLAKQSAADEAGLKYQCFKYQDVSGQWRLLWCPGYLAAAQRQAARPAVCANPDCRQLALVDRGTDRKCPRCGGRVPRRSLVARHAKGLAALLLLLLCAAGAYTAGRSRATLGGRIVRAADGQPIAGAEIRIGSSSQPLTSDAQGGFEQRLFPRRGIPVRVSAPGFREQSLQTGLAFAGVSRLEVRLIGGAQVAGRVIHVLGPDELPVADARLRPVGLQVDQAVSGRDGTFQLQSLPPGPVQVQVSAEGFAAREVTAVAVVEASSAMRIVMTGNGTLAGTVVHAADGKTPIAEAEVSVTGLEGAGVRTDAEGRFSLAAVPPVAVQVQATAAGFRPQTITAAPGPNAQQISLRGNAILTGTVLRGDTDQPVAGAEVSVAGMPLQTRTDEQGRYRLADVRSGPVQIAATAPGLAALVPHELPADQETDVPITLVGGATLRGRVLNAADHQAVAEATVAVAETRLSTKTNAQGEFTLSGVPVAKVTLRVAAEGFVPQDREQPLSEGEQTVDDVGLIPTVPVRGVVVRAVDGQPVAGAMVAIAETRSTAQTDGDGRFAFTGIPPGQIRVGVVAPGFRKQVVPANPGPATEPLRIQLTGDAVLSGTVMRSDTQQPASGAEVRVEGTPFKAQTDAQGRFRLEGVCSGPAQIAASLPGLSAARAQDLLPEQESTVELLLKGGATITGRVIGAPDQRPVAGAVVTVEQTQLAATCDAEGRFTLADVPASSAALRVSAGGYAPKSLAQDLAAGTRDLGDIPLAPLAAVSGQVVRLLDGRPVADAEVSAVDGQASARTNAEGAFALSGLPAGPVRLRVAAAGFRPQEVNQELKPGEQALGEPVKLTGDAVVSGATVDAGDRRPVPGAQVEIRVAGKSKSVTSGPDGHFDVGYVPAGETVEVTAQAEGYQNAEVRRPVSADDARIEVPMTRLPPPSPPPPTRLAKSPRSPAPARPRPEPSAPPRPERPPPSPPSQPPGARGGPAGPGTGGGGRGRIADTELNRSPRRAGEGVLRGRVVNAVNGRSVPGARVDVNVLGDRRTTYSDSSGNFAVSEMREGLAEIDVTRVGFEPAQLTHQVGNGAPCHVVLCPDLKPGEVRIVLTWNAQTPDLDAHLYGPQRDGGEFHVYHKKPTAPDAKLDTDAQDGSGPETITVKTTKGTYRYYVADPDSLNTANGETLAGSQAQVRVYFQGNRSKEAFQLPPGARGPIWHVFDIHVGDAGNITVLRRDDWKIGLP